MKHGGGSLRFQGFVSFAGTGKLIRKRMEKTWGYLGRNLLRE